MLQSRFVLLSVLLAVSAAVSPLATASAGRTTMNRPRTTREVGEQLALNQA